MDIKRLLTGMAVALLLVISWNQLILYLGKTHPEWGWSTTQPTTLPAVSPFSPSTQSTPVAQVEMPKATAVTTTGPATTQAASRFAAVPSTQPDRVTLGSAAKSDPAFTMALTVSPRGAGLSDVVLNDFRRTVETQDPYVFQQPYGGVDDDETRSLATRSITIDDSTVDLLGRTWDLVSRTNTSATYRATVTRDGLPAVQVEKTYTLTPRTNDEKTPEGYEVTVAYKVKNLTGAPIAARLDFNGPNAPPRENDRADDRTVVGGYNHEGFAVLNHASITELTKDKPTKDFSTDPDGKPFLWAGIGSVYFNAVVRPDQTQPIQILYAQALGLNLDNPLDQHAMMKFQTNVFTLPAGASATAVSQVFLGPKKRELLNNAYYAAPLIKYDATLVMTSGLCGFCTFTPIINGLYFLLSIFHMVLRDWGLAIICLVFVVRACLHPITKRSQVNMAKMSKMGPEIERLKKKHGDNKDELNKAMMQFYKTQGATPILGCLPMFLQMPIWIALYSSLQSTFELRQSPFLWGLTWIKDLAHPDRLIYFPTAPFQFFFIHLDAINVLPIILGVVSFMQAKVTQAQQPPPSTPEQAQQQKMMKWMTLMLPVILYNGPSGLNLYIMTSSIFGIIESKIVRKHIVEREALEKAGAVIVDSKPDDLPPPGTVRRKGGPTEPEKKPGGIMGWIGELQRKAEEMQKEQMKKGKKK